MYSQVLVPVQLGRKGVGKASYPHLEAGSVLDEGGAVAADHYVGGGGFRVGLGEKGSVVLNEEIEGVDGYEVAVGEGYVGIDHGDLHPCRLDSRDGTVHGGAQRDHPVGVGRGDLDHRRAEPDAAGPVEPLRVRQVDWDVVGVPGVDVRPDIRADEESLLEEDSFEFRIRVRSVTLRVEVMEVQVLDLAGARPPYKGVDEYVRDAGYAAQVDVVS